MSNANIPGLVTVVVASYNHARFLERRMDSLLAQTYKKMEIIVIDDKSPDNSVEILRHYQRDSRVKIIEREQNGGWVKVSNQGAQLARGEFVLFGNCDDACDPRMIEYLVNAICNHPTAGIAFCRSLFTDEEDKVVGDDFSNREPDFRSFCQRDVLISARQMSLFLLDSCAIPNLSAALIRRDVFTAVGDFSSAFQVCSDWDFYFRVARQYDVAYVATPLNHFRQHSATIRSTVKERVINEEIFSLLLQNLRDLHLGFWQNVRYRNHVMYLWSVHIIAPSLNGFRNFAYLLRRIGRIDVTSLLFLPVGLLMRSVSVAGKVFSRFLVFSKLR